MIEGADRPESARLRQLRSYPKYKDSGVEGLAEIPSHWNALPIKRVCRLCYGDSLPAGDRANGGIAVFGSNGPIGTHDRANAGAPCIIVGRKSSFGKVNYSAVPVFAIDTTFFTDTRHTKEDLVWLYYTLHSARLDTVSKDSAIPGLDRGNAYRRTIAVSPIHEQRDIATFLDRETAKIDSLVAQKERLIDLLQEKRTALITRAVTRGLDPNVPTKDSGVEWLGQVPAHWQVKKIKRLCLVRRGASPRPIDDPAYFDDDGAYAWVRISDVTASERYLKTTTQRLSTLGQSKSVALEPGELFLSIAATVGKPIITTIRCCIHDGFVYFVGLQENREFLFYLVSCGEAYKGLGKLGTQLNLNTDTIGGILVPVPKPDEQQAIVRSLNCETKVLDALIAEVRKAVSLLCEFRTALISAAVTGKIDVRETTPR